jgi:dienelactone hydrolase
MAVKAMPFRMSRVIGVLGDMIRSFVAVFFLLLSVGTALAESVSFQSIAVSNASAGPMIKACIYRPASNGPFPAVILAHPCGGVDGFTDNWGKLLSSWGYLVLAPDSLGSRGLTSVCNGEGFSPNDGVADAAGALDFLAARSDVIKGRVAIVGHSHGGKVVLRAVQKRYNLAARGLRGGVGYYLDCNTEQDCNIALPLLMFLGDKDDWLPSDSCKSMSTVVPNPPLDAVFYPGAMHGFDNDFLISKSVSCNKGACHIGYDAKIAADAFGRIRVFLDALLR